MHAPTLAGVTLPSPEEEVWRYSRIAELDLTAFHPVERRTARGSLPGAVRDLLSAIPERAGAVVVVDGTVIHTELAEPVARRGVWFGPARESASADPAGAGREPVDVFAGLNAERCTDPVLLHVPAGVEVPRPFVVVDWLETEAAAVFPRLVVRLGAGADATVVEWHGSADVHALACPVTDLAVEQGAHLGQVTVQHRGHRVWQIASQGSTVGQQASLVAAQIGLGGDYARTRTDCRLEGRGASGKLLAAYFGEGAQTLDFRTFQDHLAPDTTSNLLFKGAVGGSSRSVYTGLIHVGKHARGTNAFQTNRNIKLSEHAWAESVPNLEIENNDVRCSHASTVGPVDEEQRFYLESRGVPTAVAARLIVSGFFDEVLSQLPVSAVRSLVEGEIDRRLERSERP
jgi:Fe-S cluster assembly protein SufD